MDYSFSEDRRVLSLAGELVFTEHRVFRNIATLLVAAAGTYPVTLELSKLEFIDSAGLGMLLILRDEIHQENRPLILKGARGQVKKMLALSRFELLFAVEA